MNNNSNDSEIIETPAPNMESKRPSLKKIIRTRPITTENNNINNTTNDARVVKQQIYSDEIPSGSNEILKFDTNVVNEVAHEIANEDPNDMSTLQHNLNFRSPSPKPNNNNNNNNSDNDDDIDIEKEKSLSVHSIKSIKSNKSLLNETILEEKENDTDNVAPVLVGQKRLREVINNDDGAMEPHCKKIKLDNGDEMNEITNMDDIISMNTNIMDDFNDKPNSMNQETIGDINSDTKTNIVTENILNETSTPLKSIKSTSMICSGNNSNNNNDNDSENENNIFNESKINSSFAMSENQYELERKDTIKSLRPSNFQKNFVKHSGKKNSVHAPTPQITKGKGSIMINSIEKKLNEPLSQVNEIIFDSNNNNKENESNNNYNNNIDDDDDIKLNEINITIDGCDINELKVSDLKREAVSRNLNQYGKKSELINRIKEYIISNTNNNNGNSIHLKASPTMVKEIPKPIRRSLRLSSRKNSKIKHIKFKSRK